MTRFFLESLYNERKCALCKAPSAKSLCPEHLEQAKMRWRNWTEERVSKKKCVRCNKRSFKIKPVISKVRQGVFCKTHSIQNRERCRIWDLTNKDRIKEQYLARKAAGICTRNPLHGMATNGTLCRGCRKIRRGYK